MAETVKDGTAIRRRQEERGRDGRYSRGNACEVCTKPAPFMAYASHPEAGGSILGGMGLVLCLRKRCPGILDDPWQASEQCRLVREGVAPAEAKERASRFAPTAEALAAHEAETARYRREYEARQAAEAAARAAYLAGKGAA